MTEPNRRSRKRLQTRDHLASVALALFERDGFDSVTMEQIAAEADVARATLYNHFPVKEAVLVHAMHAQLAQDLEPLIARVLAVSGFVDRMTLLLDASAGWWALHRQYAAPYIRFRFQDVHNDASEMLSAYTGLIAQAQASGELRSAVPADRSARYLHYLYLSGLMAWLADPGLRLTDEFRQALDFFMRGAAK